jgi:hypothetical protein
MGACVFDGGSVWEGLRKDGDWFANRCDYRNLHLRY